MKGKILILIVVVAVSSIFIYVYSKSSQIAGENVSESDIYVSIVMHNEDPLSPLYPDYTTDNLAYVQSRENLRKFAEMLHEHGLPFNWQSDWGFLEGARKWETDVLMSNTNGKNIVRYLNEDLGVAIDPHSHEHAGYNYADVAYLIENLGVTPSSVVGGHTYDPADPEHYQSWPKFRQPLIGHKYAGALWKGDILWGAASSLHENDPVVSGVWKPKDENHYFTHSESQSLVAIGTYDMGPDNNNIDGVLDLVQKMESGNIERGNMYTVTIITNQYQLSESFINSFEENIVQQLKELKTKAKIHLVTITEAVGIWNTKYNGEPNLYQYNI